MIRGVILQVAPQVRSCIHPASYPSSDSLATKRSVPRLAILEATWRRRCYSGDDRRRWSCCGRGWHGEREERAREQGAEAPATKRPPARYGPLEEEFTVEINYSEFFCGFGAAKSYVDGKQAKFDGCEADTWSPLWLTDFMEQLGYRDRDKNTLYWLLPGKDLGSGLRIIDRDVDTMHMIAVVPKFQYFQIFVDHKDMNFDDDVVIDDVVIGGSPSLPPVLSPTRGKYKAAATSSGSSPARQQQYSNGHELRRSTRKLELEEEAQNGSDDDNDSELDEDWVDSDNELAADDDDLFEEWVDEKFEEKMKKKSKWEQDSDYDTDEDLEELQDSDVEAADSAEEVEVVDKQGRKKMKKKVKLRRWRPENMRQVEFRIGMVFLSVIGLRGAIQEYIVQQRVGVHYKKNDLQRIRACCEPKCSWFLYDAPDSRSKAWTVKKYVGHHKCERDFKIKQFTARYLAAHYVEKFRCDDKMSSRSKLERARRIALKQIHGDELAQYNLLWDFAAEIRRSNPGSTMFVNANAGVFQNCYMSLDACKRGFLAGCGPIIGIDGCHMKNRFGGVMLAAVGVDPNDCIYPISIAIVEVEDTVTWKWFLSTLKDDLGIENTRPWTFMSDRQKGLINAVNAIWPEAQHRFCVRHLHQNFARNGFRGDILKNKLWQIARATRQCDWQIYMDEMKALDVAAFEYLDAIDPRQWCKAFFEELPKCDLLLNNICEVFNRYILDARELPIVTSLKKIKDQVMLRYFSKRKELEEMCGNICHKIRKKLAKNIDFATNYEALPSLENLFKVKGLRGEYEVRIDKMECTCRAWQLSGIPCRHACAAFRHERIKPESAVHKCYSLDASRAAYGGAIMPCGDPKMWKKMNGPEMRPPKFDKQIGRPSKKRRKSPLEEEGGTRLSRHGIIGHCGVCNEPGHTKRKCPELGRAAGQQAAAPQEAPPAAAQYAPQEAPQHAPATAQHAQPPMKMPVKRNSTAKKKIVHQMATSATASIVESAMSYSVTSSSVIHVLQEQAIETQQSQTAPPGPLPESQFIASCRDELPPPRPPSKTLGLKKKNKEQVSKKKENQVPDV